MDSKMKGGELIMIEQNIERALDNFVEREVYACQSSLVEEALNKQLFTVDEIYNLYVPFVGRVFPDAVCSRCSCEFSLLDRETGNCEGCFEETQEPQEIFEWWLVSPWLGKKLLLEGEPVIDNGYGVWWGRTTTGQAISLDYIIGKIYSDIMGYVK
jgi:hypothetical protein